MARSLYLLCEFPTKGVIKAEARAAGHELLKKIKAEIRGLKLLIAIISLYKDFRHVSSQLARNSHCEGLRLVRVEPSR